MMKIEVRGDRVLIEGYVNAIERDSKLLFSPIGRFKERICKGAFSKALQRNDDVKILLNHSWERMLGGTKDGNLELHEDSIGLRARAEITDSEVIDKAKKGDLVGWSFGFSDVEGGVLNGEEKGIPVRELTDLNLYEVSILDRTRTPAYDGTLLEARSDGEVIQFRELEDPEQAEVEIIREKPTATIETEKPQEKIDYTAFEDAIKTMKGN